MVHAVTPVTSSMRRSLSECTLFLEVDTIEHGEEDTPCHRRSDWSPGLDSIASILVNFTMHDHKPKKESWRIENA